MENRGGRIGARRHFCRGGFWHGHQRLDAHQLWPLIDLTQVAHTIWSYLFRYDTGTEMSVTSAWIVLGLTCVICLWLLAKRVRPLR